MATPEPLPPLADPADLAAIVGTTADDPKVAAALRKASGRFRDAVRHQVHHVDDDTIVVDGSGTRSLRLPIAHLTDVAAVLVDDRDVEVEWSADGILERADGRLWPRGRRRITVTASHGLDPIPEGIAAAVLDQAEATYNLVRGIASLSVGGLQAGFGAQEALGVSEQWSAAVERWRIRAGDRA